MNPPEELTEYLICEKMGWTITELEAQPYRKVEKFIKIMKFQAKAEKARNEQNGV